jgi:stearoyl-CoA desaturase (delta-9 desaturase)
MALATTDPAGVWNRKNNWPFISWFVFVILGVLVTPVYLGTLFFQMPWWQASLITLADIVLGIVWFFLCGMAIVGGYHRLYSHRSGGRGKIHLLVHLFTIVFGAAGFTGSVKWWSVSHRQHHRYPDTVLDPYNIKEGWWWAHIGWVIKKDRKLLDYSHIKDLCRNNLEGRLLAFQDRFWIPLGILFGFLVPAGIGWLWGSAIGALLMAGFVRLACQYHQTWCVNSDAHTDGEQTYETSTATKSRLNAWKTFGEGGDHARHHKYPSNWWQSDYWYEPGRWFLWTCYKLGLVEELVEVDMTS